MRSSPSAGVAPFRFGIALGLVLASYLAFCVGLDGATGRLLVLFAYSGTLAFVLRTTGLAARTLRLATPIAVAVVLVSLATLTGDSTRARGLGGVLGAMLLVASIGAISRGAAKQARTEDRISLSTVVGVVTIYLLLGLIYATMFGALGTFHGEGFLSGAGADPTGVDLVYFSVVTMATLGYGDITALTDVGRLTAISEALLGQLYLVTVVAVVVSNIGRRPNEKRSGAEVT